MINVLAVEVIYLFIFFQFTKPIPLYLHFECFTANRVELVVFFKVAHSVGSRAAQQFAVIILEKVISLFGRILRMCDTSTGVYIISTSQMRFYKYESAIICV